VLLRSWKDGFQRHFAYDLSKAALNHFMRCAALELIEHGIHLNAVDIGWTHTPGERRWFSEEEQNRLSRSIPIGRAAQADEIAAVIEFLLSEQASYVVVGSLYAVEGGFTLRPNPSL
jgi:glucose 1-dehydrogenase